MTYTEDDLTPWFPADVKPVRPGLYQRKWPVLRYRDIPDYFDGERWFAVNGSGCISITPFTHPLPWRGLNKQP